VAALACALGGCGPAAQGPAWGLLADEATVGTRDDAGACWVSPACGPPTTYVCVTADGLRSCSSPRTAAAPMWFEQVASASTATLDRGISVELRLGSGGASDRTICRSTVIVDEAARRRGKVLPPCTPSVSLTLGVVAPTLTL
jgi:hypothetical protein